MNAVETMLASEDVLAKDWDTPEEDEAWEALADTILVESGILPKLMERALIERAKTQAPSKDWRAELDKI